MEQFGGIACVPHGLFKTLCLSGMNISWSYSKKNEYGNEPGDCEGPLHAVVTFLACTVGGGDGEPV